eukprot:g13172.t1
MSTMSGDPIGTYMSGARWRWCAFLSRTMSVARYPACKNSCPPCCVLEAKTSHAPRWASGVGVPARGAAAFIRRIFRAGTALLAGVASGLAPCWVALARCFPSNWLRAASTEQARRLGGARGGRFFERMHQGRQFCFKSTNTPANIGPGAYCSPESVAPERIPARSHNYLIQRSEEIARNRRDLWVQRRMQTMSSATFKGALMGSGLSRSAGFFGFPPLGSVESGLDRSGIVGVGGEGGFAQGGSGLSGQQPPHSGVATQLPSASDGYDSGAVYPPEGSGLRVGEQQHTSTGPNASMSLAGGGAGASTAGRNPAAPKIPQSYSQNLSVAGAGGATMGGGASGSNVLYYAEPGAAANYSVQIGEASVKEAPLPQRGAAAAGGAGQGVGPNASQLGKDHYTMCSRSLDMMLHRRAVLASIRELAPKAGVPGQQQQAGTTTKNPFSYGSRADQELVGNLVQQYHRATSSTLQQSRPVFTQQQQQHGPTASSSSTAPFPQAQTQGQYQHPRLYPNGILQNHARPNKAHLRENAGSYAAPQQQRQQLQQHYQAGAGPVPAGAAHVNGGVAASGAVTTSLHFACF